MSEQTHTPHSKFLKCIPFWPLLSAPIVIAIAYDEIWLSLVSLVQGDINICVTLLRNKWYAGRCYSNSLCAISLQTLFINRQITQRTPNTINLTELEKIASRHHLLGAIRFNHIPFISEQLSLCEFRISIEQASKWRKKPGKKLKWMNRNGIAAAYMIEQHEHAAWRLVLALRDKWTGTMPRRTSQN